MATTDDMVNILKKASRGGGTSGAGAEGTESELNALEQIISKNKGFVAEVRELSEEEQAQKEKEEAQRAKEEAEAKLKAIQDAKLAERLQIEEEAHAHNDLLNGLGDTQILFTTITEGRLPKSGINWVIDIFPKAHWDKEHDVNIPDVDEFFYWDVEVLEQLILCRKLREKGLLVGFPGTGKTSSVKQFSAWLRQPYARFNGKGGIEPSSFLGSTQVVQDNGGTETQFKEGLMPMAVRNNYMTTIDEVMKLTPDIQMALQSLYEKDGFLMLDDKPGTIEEKHIYPGNDFQMYCTDNTCGDGSDLELFAAGQMQDTSTLDRFGMTIIVGYLPFDEEVSMFQRKFPMVELKDIESSVRFAGLVRTGFKGGDVPVTLSPRGLSTICGLVELGVDVQLAVEMTYLNKIGDDVAKQAAYEFRRTVWK